MQESFDRLQRKTAANESTRNRNRRELVWRHSVGLRSNRGQVLPRRYVWDVSEWLCLRFADAHGRKSVALVASVGAVIGHTMTGLAGTWSVVMLSRFMLGMVRHGTSTFQATLQFATLAEAVGVRCWIEQAYTADFSSSHERSSSIASLNTMIGALALSHFCDASVSSASGTVARGRLQLDRSLAETICWWANAMQSSTAVSVLVRVGICGGPINERTAQPVWHRHHHPRWSTL